MIEEIIETLTETYPNDDMPDEPVLELIGAEHATIVDVTYKRIDLFLVQIFKNEKGEHVYIPMYYDLQDGDMIIFDDWQKANELAERWTVVLFKAIEREWIGAGEEIPQPEPVDPIIPPALPGGGLPLQDFTPQEVASFMEQWMIKSGCVSEGNNG